MKLKDLQGILEYNGTIVILGRRKKEGYPLTAIYRKQEIDLINENNLEDGFVKYKDYNVVKIDLEIGKVFIIRENKNEE